MLFDCIYAVTHFDTFPVHCVTSERDRYKKNEKQRRRRQEKIVHTHIGIGNDVCLSQMRKEGRRTQWLLCPCTHTSGLYVNFNFQRKMNGARARTELCELSLCEYRVWFRSFSAFLFFYFFLLSSNKWKKKCICRRSRCTLHIAAGTRVFLSISLEFLRILCTMHRKTDSQHVRCHQGASVWHLRYHIHRNESGHRAHFIWFVIAIGSPTPICYQSSLWLLTSTLRTNERTYIVQNECSVSVAAAATPQSVYIHCSVERIRRPWHTCDYHCCGYSAVSIVLKKNKIIELNKYITRFFSYLLLDPHTCTVYIFSRRSVCALLVRSRSFHLKWHKLTANIW